MSLTDGSGYACFEAIYDYAPDTGEIELKVGDQCYVSKPINDPQGWLDGVNMRSRESGQFPGTYCRIVDINAAPPRPKKPTPGSRHSTQMTINGHTVEKICVMKPAWCMLCDEYIWGGGKISLICSCCLLCSHVGCNQLFNCYVCADMNAHQVKPKSELLKPVTDWMPDEVLEWMVAANLLPYISIIRKMNLFGKDLGIIKEQLLMDMGISFDLHRKLFMICIEELMRPPPTAEQFNITIPLTENKDIHTHAKLHDHTFTTQQLCNLCNEPFYGVYRQGIMCDVCGMQCHRPCAFAMNNRQCAGTNMTARRSSVSEDPSFCCNFNTIEIPPVMRKCVEAVERNGLLVPDIYTKSAPYDQFQTLKSALNQSPELVNMNDEYWRDPACAAHVLKTFLLELPMPLVHFDIYEPITELVSREKILPENITDVWVALPDSNRSHLTYLLKHLTKILNSSESNGMTKEMVSDLFSFLIVRPKDNEASKFIMNLDLHGKVVSFLLDTYDSYQPKEEDIDSDIDSGKWLWSDGTRKDVSQCLLGAPDGSFLIRPSEARRGDWTLTVRKEGRDRLIKIMSRDGLFGFREDHLKFKTLHELVKHFRENSLKDYNEKLDITLKYPCAKAEKIQVKDNSDVKERFQQLSEKLKEIKCIEFKVEEQYQQYEECKSLSESQTDVVNFIEEQISLANRQFQEVSNQDKKELLQSQQFLNKLLAKEKMIWMELDEQLSALSHEYNLLKAQLTELSTELPVLREQYNQLEPKMRELSPDIFNKEEDDVIETYYDQLPSVVSQRSSNDLPEQSWLFGHLEKKEIMSMLENKPNGTFLVRRSRNHPYAISLVHDNQIKHIPIQRGPNGYGFAEPHNTYQTLHELINHYHNQSLRLHNRTLDTTLRIPYKFLDFRDEPIYDVMSPSVIS